MPKGSPELTAARENEIIEACLKLYETKSFKEITLKDIGTETTFGRTSIYNYFQTKEEIFLAILRREYELWNEELSACLLQNDNMSKEEFAKFLAKTLSVRKNLLKILSMNMFDIEANSREEKLVEFKQQFGRSLSLVEECLKKFFSDMKKKQRQEFIYSFFPFVYGIYPYTSVTEKQKNAMQAAGIPYQFYSVYEITLNGAKKLLGV